MFSAGLFQKKSSKIEGLTQIVPMTTKSSGLTNIKTCLGCPSSSQSSNILLDTVQGF